MTHNIFRLSIFALVGMLLAVSANATPKNWATGDGNWSVGSNWSPVGVPVATDDANILFADGLARTISYDYTGSPVNLSGLTLDGTGAGANPITLQINGNSLTTAHETIGANGVATVNQSGGLNNITDYSFIIGDTSTSTGAYNLSGGTIATRNEIVGASGTATFTQTNGTNDIADGLSVGDSATGLGVFNLSGGVLQINNFEYEGYQATGNATQSGGTFLQSGGQHSVTYLLIGANAGSTGTYSLTSGVLSSTTESIGLLGQGSFVQQGGTNSANVISIASMAGSQGAYTLAGGFANTTDLSIGVGDFNVGGSGTFTVNGANAVLNVSGKLTVNNTPGSRFNLAGGTLAANAINVQGIPSLFNWTNGTMEITQDAAWDSGGAPTSTSVIFGNSLTLSTVRTLRVDGNETIGGTGPFTLTLNTGATHTVAGDVTLKSGGTLVESGTNISLSYNNFIQAGGALSNTFRNISNYTYKSGSITSAQFINDGTATFAGTCSISGSMQNDNLLNLTNGLSFSASSGITNAGSFYMNGGTIAQSGSGFVNSAGALLDARGSISTTLTNHGTLNISGILNAASINNDGIIQGSGNVVNPSSSFANSAGGIINGTTPGGALVFSQFTGNNFGIINVGPTSTLTVTSSWSNSGLVNLQGSSARLTGGLLTNNDTIQGSGLIASAISNGPNAVVRASGGELDFSSGSSTFNASSQLQAGAGSTLMFLAGLATNPGTISLTGGTFDNNSHTLTNNGTVNGYGTIRTSAFTNSTSKLLSVGEGNLDVFGNFTNNGVVNIQTSRSAYFFGPVNGAGNFSGGGTAVFLASLSPGNSPGTLAIAGNATLVGGTSLIMELAGTAPRTQQDHLSVDGILSIGGILSVSLLNGFMPAVGTSFDLLDWGTLSGTFSSLNLPTLATGQWDTSQLYSTGALSVIPSPLAGDYNNNGVVDAADYVAWRHGLGTTYTQTDYDVWRANFGNTAASGSGSQFVSGQAQVPESTAILLGLIGLCNLAASRRGRSRI